MFCPNCGKPSDTNVCKNCGANIPDNPPEHPVQQNPSPQVVQHEPRKRPFYVKWWFIIIVLLALGALISSLGGGNDNGALNNIGSSGVQGEENKSPAKPNESNDNILGDYKVEILSARTSKDYEGNDAIIVKYSFQNNSDEDVSFSLATQDKAFQNGVELETAIIIDDKSFNAEDSLKDIKPGASIEVESAFNLADNSKVTVEVEELFSFTSKKITREFDLSELK